MSQHDRFLAPRVAASLLREHRTSCFWFWGIVVLVYVGIVLADGAFGPLIGPQTDLWGGVASQASRWFLFTIGILMTTLYLPVYIAHGLTRREFAAGGALFGGLVGILFGLVMLVGYLVQPWVYPAAPPPPQPLPLLPVHQGLMALIWFVAGGLIGTGFYRYFLWGALAIPLGLALMAGTSASAAATLAGTFPRLAPVAEPVSVAIRIGLLVLALMVSYAALREVPLRTRQT